MPRISTDNYDTVASWNGSQDLFIVEQPDGTKVATPAMVKQYILAGVTETSEQYAECSTARNVTAKTVTLPGFELETGARISVRFTDTGTSNPASGNITLNVNGTGAKEIIDGHANMTKATYTYNWFYNNQTIDFIYDGTYWVNLNRDNNTTYTSKAAASGGTATSLCTTGEKYTWNNKQNALTFDNVPTQNSNNPVKSGGIFSTIGDLSQTGLTGDSVAEQLDTAREQIADVIANRALLPIVNDSTVSSATNFDMGSSNGVYLVIVGQGGSVNLLGLYLVKITHYAAGTNVATIVTPTQNPPTVTATEITSSQGGKITITPNGLSIHAAIYKFILNMA